MTSLNLSDIKVLIAPHKLMYAVFIYVHIIVVTNLNLSDIKVHIIVMTHNLSDIKVLIAPHKLMYAVFMYI